MKISSGLSMALGAIFVAAGLTKVIGEVAIKPAERYGRNEALKECRVTPEQPDQTKLKQPKP